jgi:DNA repair exonuclease SbcCD ATPase subunit
MNMGERGEPHGVAVVEEGQLEPQWIDWNDFPKHHRFVFGSDWNQEYIGKYVKPHDVVEVHAAPNEMGSAAFSEAVAAIPAVDIRTLPVKNGAGDAAPAFALSLDEALESWVDETLVGPKQKLAPEMAVQLKMLGRELLKQVPEAKAITPIAPYVAVKGVRVQNFCAIRGPLQFDMPEGAVLIQGLMGVGKTSLMDALTWCLFGSTTPRKAGSHGASLRADEVVHDDTGEACVEVQLQVGDDEVLIVRTKKRGSSSKVAIEGIDPGISDHQEQIHRILGIDLDLWRTCVYLGQGAVGTFVTDADRRRKDLLSMAFGLNACPPAQKLARDKAKLYDLKAEKVRIELAGDEKVLQVLQESDFAEQIQAWDQERTQHLSAIRASGEQASVMVSECTKHLEAEPRWLESQQKYQEHLEALTKSLVRQSPQAQVASLQRELGGFQAERSMLERDLVLAKEAMVQHLDGQLACPTCGREFDPAMREQHAQELEQKVQSLQQTMKTFDVKISNVAEKLDAINTQGSTQREGVETQLDDCNENLAKCAEALNQFVRIKANKADAERRLHEARGEYAKREAQINPFLAKQAEKDERVKTLQAKIRADQAEQEGHEAQAFQFDFWDRGFGPKGLPVLVLRAALHELELYANQFMAKLLHGRIYCQLAMADDDLKILFFELDKVTQQPRERRYEQLSGGQRRCVELAFNPFALSEMIFNRCGVRFSLLVVDELTTHLGQAEKPIICDILGNLDRESIVVIDHDPTVQGEFDVVLEMKHDGGAVSVERAA